MYYCIGFFFRKDFLYILCVNNILFVKFKRSLFFGNASRIICKYFFKYFLYFFAPIMGIVHSGGHMYKSEIKFFTLSRIIVIKIIYTYNIISSPYQCPAYITSNKTRCSCDNNFHSYIILLKFKILRGCDIWIITIFR